jgi:MGT family glycosyltransferase
MSRFLFAVPPFAGHVNPTVAVGGELASRGHEVAWVGHASILSSLLPRDATIFATDSALPAETFNSIAARGQGLRGAEAFRFLWKDVLIPLGEAMLSDVELAVNGFLPDVMIVDQQAIAGAVIARRKRLRWATSATTSSELIDSFTVFPMFANWLSNELRSFQLRMGISEKESAMGDLRFSEQLVIAFTTPDLVGGGPLRQEWLFVGPAMRKRQRAPEFPWSWLDRQRRHVLLTLGTINAATSRKFFETAITAAAQLSDRLQMIVVSPDGMLTSRASNALVLPAVPQLELLPHMDIVICHAGHNTVCESLANGIPLIVAPIRDDQPIIAQQVVEAGAGIRLKYGRVKPEDIVSALLAVLEAGSYRESAKRIQRSFRDAGGSAAAADGLEGLVARAAA